MATYLRLICCLLLIAGVRLESTIQTEDTEKVAATTAKLVAEIDDTLTTLGNGIENFKKNTWTKVDFCLAYANNLVDKVRSFVDLSVSKLDNELTRLFENKIADATCNLLGRFKDSAMTIFDSVNSCVNGTIDGGIARVRKISQIGTDIRMSLQNYRKQAILCAKESTEVSAAMSCLAKTSTGAKTIIKLVPTVLANFAELGVVVATFPQKLQYCAARGPIDAISDHYLAIMTKLPECVRSKFYVWFQYLWAKVQAAYYRLREKFRGKLPSVEEVVDSALAENPGDHKLSREYFEMLRGVEHKNVIAAPKKENDPYKLSDQLLADIVYGMNQKKQ